MQPLRLLLGLLLALASASAAFPQSPDSVIAEVGSVAPDFALKDLKGKTLHLSEFRGKVVVLNFWATWCTPCRHETPLLVDVAGKYKDKLSVIGVSMDDPEFTNIADFVRDEHITYTTLIGDDLIGHQYLSYGALPVTYFISAEGKILKKFAGAVTEHELQEAVRSFVGKQTAASAGS